MVLMCVKMIPCVQTVLLYLVFASFANNETGAIQISDITGALRRNVLTFLSDCTVGANKTRLLFHSRSVNGTEVNLTDPAMSLPIDPSLRTIFIAHGFLSDGTKDWINDTVAAFLRNEPLNIFSVDWRVGACSEKIDFLNIQSYSSASANTEQVGEYVAGCVTMLKTKYGVKLKNVWFVGHSLGAHVSGFVGKTLQKREVGTLGRITGLDPAGPLFRALGKTERLDKTDASFVEVIHTSSLFGLMEPIGHVDFYMNGGKFQSSCFLKKPGCSHDRAVDYYIEAVTNPDCLFRGKTWLRKSGYANSPANCTLDSCTVMGPQAERFSARGTFFVKTSNGQPYCTGKLPEVTESTTTESYDPAGEENLFDAHM